MEDELLHLVAKYFYFTCLDESLSFAASLKVLQEIRSKPNAVSNRAFWISVMEKWKRRLPSLHPRRWDGQKDEGFYLPGKTQLSAWIAFQTEALTEEADAVLFSHILGFTDQEIADGLNVTTGTVRYRVGRGLRQLGGHIES